jgi:hypothetical protein
MLIAVGVSLIVSPLPASAARRSLDLTSLIEALTLGGLFAAWYISNIVFNMQVFGQMGDAIRCCSHDLAARRQILTAALRPPIPKRSYNKQALGALPLPLTMTTVQVCVICWRKS